MAIEEHPVPEVREAYSAYAPPFDVAAVVRNLLGYVPEEYLQGLGYVALLNTSGFSRRERRRKILSRGKRHWVSRCLGFYCRQRPGHPAHIKLHVDRIIQQAPRLALGVSVYRDSFFARTLYHEVGHHIDRAWHPRHHDIESAADGWAQRLRNVMLRQKYHCLTPEDWKRVTDVAAKLERRRRR